MAGARTACSRSGDGAPSVSAPPGSGEDVLNNIVRFGTTPPKLQRNVSLPTVSELCSAGVVGALDRWASRASFDGCRESYVRSVLLGHVGPAPPLLCRFARRNMWTVFRRCAVQLQMLLISWCHRGL